MTIGSLFSGIGGLELGLERAGLGPVVWQAEANIFCRGVLARHWPSAKRLVDVREVKRGTVEEVDLVCGGFPCQDVSQAGRGAGIAEGTRSGLWIEFARILGELRPPLVVVENVPGLRNRGLRRVLADLAGLGFDAAWTTLGAFEVGAPHRRDRLFVIAADPDRVDVRDIAERIETRRLDVRASRQAEPYDDGETRAPSDADGERLEALPASRVHGERPTWDNASRRRGSGGVGYASPQPCIRRVDDGISSGVGRWDERIRALGNAVVPQCAELIGLAIVDALEAKGAKP